MSNSGLEMGFQKIVSWMSLKTLFLELEFLSITTWKSFGHE